MKKFITIVAMTAIIASGADARVPRRKAQFVYPKAPTSQTVDNYFGIKLADPYRPLENDTAAATLQWVKEENALTRKYLDNIPARARMKERLGELYNYRRSGLPFRGNDGMYYIYDNDGTQNQSRCG